MEPTTTHETPTSPYLRPDGYFDDHQLTRDICADKANAHLTARERYELYLKRRHEGGVPIGLLSDTSNVGYTSIEFHSDPLKNVVTLWPTQDDGVRLAKLILNTEQPSITVVDDNCFRVRIRDDKMSYILPSPLPDTSPFIDEEASLFDYEYKEMILEGPLSQQDHLCEFLWKITTIGYESPFVKKKKIKRIRFLNQIRSESRGLWFIRFFVLLED